MIALLKPKTHKRCKEIYDSLTSNVTSTVAENYMLKTLQAIVLAPLILPFFSQSGSAQNAPSIMPTHHLRRAVLDGSARTLQTLPGTNILHLDLLLPLKNEISRSNFMTQLNDPSSPNYHKYLSVSQFADMFGPSESDYLAVVKWAQDNGFQVGPRSANRLLIPIDGTVEQVNKAFHVSMKAYQHPTEDRTFFSEDREPTVDSPVTLWHIVGLDNFSLPHPHAHHGAQQANISGSGPGGASYLPSDMRAAYYGSGSLTGNGQSVGLLEFDGYDISDVTGTFDGAASATANGSNYTLNYTTGGTTYTIALNNVLLDGGSVTPDSSLISSDEAETVIDIAAPIGMAPGLSQVRVYIAPSTAPTGAADIFNQMANDNIAKQLSCSWSWSPDDPSALEPYFTEFSAQGQNLFVASGDDGSWPNTLAEYYPQEDPNVTAVGGTHLTTTGAGGAWVSETAWDYSASASSSGGISPDNLPIPAYQQLSGFSCSGCSTAYRNVPDVAMEADADNYVCVLGTCAGNWYGTSFAAPRWAGYMALANQQAVANGGATEPFINTRIYQTGLGTSYTTYFHDVTSGSNGSYSAATGYDLVTGWGSPNGANLIDVFSEEPARGTITISGPEITSPNCMETTQTGIRVNGITYTFPYVSGQTNSEVAEGLGGQITSATGVSARVSDYTIQLTAITAGTGGNSIAISGTNSTCTVGGVGGIHNYTLFEVGTSGSTLTGGIN